MNHNGKEANAPYETVLAIGVFDLFHVGHLRYLKFAKSQGQNLLAGVTPDVVCHNYKGKWPVISEDERLEIVSAIRFVDETRFLPTSTEETDASIQWISDWKIDLVVVGDSWKGSERWNRLSAGLTRKGVDVIFAPETKGISSSDLVSKIGDAEHLITTSRKDSDE